ncbi:hypothetical protein O4J56_17895 [Nocardiopsis sp. RSe5-2]|uniref:DUF3592 domain-containing protein n=1 Tax=Nocardiopsis endophytica TaxID=3018445 RepID=A0ABT4U6F4_9ACTN|nr:DUF3592 domain-containing protein [Nocardiopsis endophytica]MDA2812521.1 hypothetical protein [Nocardiopsis endophytica]
MLYVVVLAVLVAAVAGLGAALTLPWFAGGYGLLLVLTAPAVVIALYLVLARMVERRRHRRFLRNSAPARAVVTRVHPLSREVNDADGHAVTLKVTPADGPAVTVEDTSGMDGYLLRSGDRLEGRLAPGDPPRFLPEAVVTGGGSRPVARHAAGPPLLGRTVGLAVTVALFAVDVLEPVLPLPGVGEPLARYGGMVVMALGVYYLWLGLHPMARSARWRGRTQGKVTTVWWRTVGIADPKNVATIVVRFAAPDGRVVHRRYPSDTYRPVQKGQSLAVHYHPAHPSRFVLPDLTERPVVWIGALFGTASLALGLWIATGF